MDQVAEGPRNVGTQIVIGPENNAIAESRQQDRRTLGTMVISTVRQRYKMEPRAPASTEEQTKP
jgi:hypothetical protein